MKKYYIFISFIILISCSTKLNDDYDSSEKVYQQKIEYSRNQLEIKNMVNPKKTRPYKSAVNYLCLSLDTIRFFTNQKDIISTLEHLQKLKYWLEGHGMFEFEYVKDIILPNRIDKWLVQSESLKLKLQNIYFFEKDMLELEAELIEFLLNSYEKDYYKFNKLIPIIIDSSNSVTTGGTYVANIMFAAIDTTFDYIIKTTDISEPDSILMSRKYDGDKVHRIPIENGFGVYRINNQTAGEKGFKGTIELIKSEGNSDIYFFEKRYVVR